jgi:hypothetical protein
LRFFGSFRHDRRNIAERQALKDSTGFTQDAKKPARLWRSIATFSRDFDRGAPCKCGGRKLNKHKTSHKTDAIQVDWIVMIASAISLAVAIVASVQAGKDGLAAHVVDYVTLNHTES